MKESLLRTLSQSTLNLSPYLHSKPNPHRIPPTLSSSSSRLFSSKAPDPSESNLDQSQNKDGDISDEELIKKIHKLVEGDEEAYKEAFPTVFQAIMSRVLAGKSYEEMRKELSIGKGKDDKESDSD